MGAIRLPIPVVQNGKEYKEVWIRRLQAGVIADTNRLVEKGDTYKGIQAFVAGCVEKIGDITDRAQISGIIGGMSFKSAFYLAVQIIFQDEKDDGVEGYYKCPRCGEEKLAEYNEDPDLDTRDFLRDLKIKYNDSGSNTFAVELSNPVEIKDEDSNTDGILKLELRYPSLNDCSMAYHKVGDKDTIRLQMQIYVQALVKVNDREVDPRFKNNFGMFVFEHMDRQDLAKIAAGCEEYGMVTEIQKVCGKCKKIFKVHVNTSNFFGSALL